MLKSFFRIFFLYLTLSLSFCSILPQASTTKPYSPKIYMMNLDLSYEEMWQELITDTKAGIQAQVTGFLSYADIPLYQKLGLTQTGILKYHDQEFVKELQAIAKLADVDFYELFLLNISYMFFEPFTTPTACTSIVAQNSNQQIFLGRNYDQDQGNVVASISATGQFYRNGKLLYTGQLLAGCPGLLTGMKTNEFAISINARFGGTLFDNVESFFSNGYVPNYLLRKTVEQAQDYNQALDMLMSNNLIYNIYFAICGNSYNNGAVIARNIDSIENLQALNGENEWYIVVTNYDTDVIPPANDQRQLPAEHKMEAIGYNDIDNVNLFNDVLSQTPNNNINTVLTINMNPALNYWNMTIWQ